MKTIAIIGAGLAGLTAANQLKHITNITVFEKSRGVSGRLSTRRAEPFYFDHGAPFFKARSQNFKDFLTPLIDAGVVKHWDARFVEIDGTTIVTQKQWDEQLPHYVGTPRMSAMTKHLSQGLNVQLSTRVGKLDKTTEGWQLFDEHGGDLGTFDWVICTAPAEQSANLIPESLSMHARIANTTMQGCYALMLGFGSPLSLDFDAALLHNSVLRWISVNPSKPDRPDAFGLTVLSSNDWADAHIDANQNWVREHLFNVTSEMFGIDASKAAHIVLHRWRYANVAEQTGEDYLLDTHAKIGVCGDWLLRGNVEAAFLSGNALSKKISEHCRNSRVYRSY